MLIGEEAKDYFQYSSENDTAFSNNIESDDNHNQKLMSGESLKIYSENGKTEPETTRLKEGTIQSS